MRDPRKFFELKEAVIANNDGPNWISIETANQAIREWLEQHNGGEMKFKPSDFTFGDGDFSLEVCKQAQRVFDKWLQNQPNRRRRMSG